MSELTALDPIEEIVQDIEADLMRSAEDAFTFASKSAADGVILNILTAGSRAGDPWPNVIRMDLRKVNKSRPDQPLRDSGELMNTMKPRNRQVSVSGGTTIISTDIKPDPSREMIGFLHDTEDKNAGVSQGFGFGPTFPSSLARTPEGTPIPWRNHMFLIPEDMDNINSAFEAVFFQ